MNHFSRSHCLPISFDKVRSLDLTTMEKAMATHSSTLAWKIPWAEEPMQSMGSWRVGHDWATSLSLFTFIHWRRKWQPTPVFLPGESQGWGSLAGCRLWGRTESGHDWSDLAAVAELFLGDVNGNHSSTLAWKIPWTEEPDRLQSMGSLGVRHDWATSLSLFTFMHWRRKWQPSPVFLQSQGWGTLGGYRL